MRDETIEGIYRLVGGFIMGLLIGISWVDFHNPYASLPSAWLPIILIASLSGFLLVLLPRQLREFFIMLSWWPYVATPFRFFLLIAGVELLIVKFLPHPKGGLIDRILSTHWWNWW